jgi:L-ribulokinase
LKPGQSGLLALDWNNGNRTILVDPMLSGLLIGQTLHSTRAEIYRTLIEATAFGARAIIERIEEYVVPVRKEVCAGGIAEKKPLLMQIYADVTGYKMQVSVTAQACALGSAVSAAVLAGGAAGGHDSFEAAQKAMTSIKKDQFKPFAANRKVYNRLYALYRQLHDSFGGKDTNANLGRLMKDLLEIKASQNN